MKTLYNHVDKGLIGINNFDLPKKLERNIKKEKDCKNRRILEGSIELRRDRVELRENSVAGKWIQW